MKKMKINGDSGFTLIELMISVALMAFIMTLVAVIFSQISTTVTTGTDRLNIYSSARAALDIFVTDINGCFPVESEQQRFTLGEDKPGENISGAQDRISFTATALVQGQPAAARLGYYLVKETDTSILGGESKDGVYEGLSKTTKTKRQLYVLRRVVTDSDGEELDSVALCHYVLSFNIEVYRDRTFRQLSALNEQYPIGDGQPVTEKLPLGLRITLRVVANAAERQERVFSRVVWIPMGE
ncbi:MAG: type II secretion system protein [Planctomycetes bacterium]|nr:type II secretion system protein [Planctomycetota bacterium]